MSVKQKLVELEQSISIPVDSLSAQLDIKMKIIIDLIVQTQMEKSSSIPMPMTPTSSNGMNSLVKDGSNTSMKSKSGKDDQFNQFNSIESMKNWNNFENLVSRFVNITLNHSKILIYLFFIYKKF